MIKHKAMYLRDIEKHIFGISNHLLQYIDTRNFIDHLFNRGLLEHRYVNIPTYIHEYLFFFTRINNSSHTIVRGNPKMATPKLTYFNTKGLGEGIRYLFAYAGVDFIDNRIEKANWPALKESK